MPKFTVGTQPVGIFPEGLQGRLSIVNEGPATVYLDRDTSINENNSYPLVPSGTMTWNPGEPLFARSRTGESRLNVNIAGGIANDARAQTYDRLNTTSIVNATSKTPDVFECGSYETLLLTVDGINYTANSGLPTVGTYIRAMFVWMDPTGSAISIETMEGWLQQGRIFFTIPVRGALCQYTVSSPVSITAAMSVLGTTRRLPATVVNYPEVYGVGVTANISRGFVTIPNWNKRDVFLPAWGHNIRLNMTISGSVATPQVVRFKDANTQETYNTTIIPNTASASSAITQAITVPRSRGIYFDCEDESAWATTTVSFTWTDYD